MSSRTLSLIGILGFFAIGPWYSYIQHTTPFPDFPIGFLLFQSSFVIVLIAYAERFRLNINIYILILFLLLGLLVSEFVKALHATESKLALVVIRNLQVYILGILVFNFLKRPSKIELSILLCSMIFIIGCIAFSLDGYVIDWTGRNKSNAPPRTTLAYASVICCMLMGVLMGHRKSMSLRFLLFCGIFVVGVSFILLSRQIFVASIISFLFLCVFISFTTFLCAFFVFILTFAFMDFSKMSRFDVSLLSNDVSFIYRIESLKNVEVNDLFSFIFGRASFDKTIDYLHPHGFLSYYDNFGFFIATFFLILIIMTLQIIQRHKNVMFTFSSMILSITALIGSTYSNYFICLQFALATSLLLYKERSAIDA